MKKIYNLAETGSIWLAGVPEAYAKVSHTQDVYLTSFNWLRNLGIVPNIRHEKDFDKVVELVNHFLNTLLKSDQAKLTPIEFHHFDGSKAKCYPANYLPEFLDTLAQALQGTQAYRELAAIQGLRVAMRETPVALTPVKTRRAFNRERMERRTFGLNVAKFWVNDWVALNLRLAKDQKFENQDDKIRFIGELVEQGVNQVSPLLGVNADAFCYDFQGGVLNFA